MDSKDQDREELERRVRRLSEEKASMGLIFSAYERFAQVDGLDDIIAFILELSLNILGGNNVILYYQVNDEWLFRDILGNAGPYAFHEESLVGRAAISMQMVDQFHPYQDVAPFMTKGSMKYQEVCSTAFPLIHARKTVAVLELTDRLLWNDQVNDELMIFYRYVAATLHASIENRAVLERKNRDLARANKDLQENLDRLRQANKEKETLLKEVHHRVKNNLQVMASILNLQAAEHSEHDLREPFRDLEARIKSMSVVHEHLYRSSDFSRIDLGDYIKSLLVFLSATYGTNSRDIQWSVQADSIELGVAQCVPCGLLLNEAVSNALKHAFPEGREGAIQVKVLREDGGCVIRISDNGVGMPETRGFDGKGHLGFQLIPALAEQLGGSVEIEGGEGTTLVLRFPLIEDESSSPGLS